MASASKKSDSGLAVVILAAGKGTRMNSSRAKVLHEIAGRPMLDYPLRLAEALEPVLLVVVVGRDSEQVQHAFADRARFVIQEPQRGTGHAVEVALSSLDGFSGDVLILYGDTPLLHSESIRRMLARRAETGAPIVMLTSPEPLPGLVIRGEDGRVQRVVEVADATPHELSIREGNTGVYLVEAEFLRKAIGRLEDANEQRELYLTDIVGQACAEGQPVEAIQLEEADEALGVNTRAELARATGVQFQRNAARLMDEGVTFIDPAHAYVDTDVPVGRDTCIDPGVVVTAGSRIGERVHLKAHTVIEASDIEDDVSIGPSAHLRPGNRIRRGVRIGNFVEVKNSDLGEGVKADHLTYIGDTDVGRGASFGAGSITVNYDWDTKHRSTVGKDVRIGCNANLIAPLRVEDGACVAAGSTVTKDAPAGSLVVARSRQRTVEGWAEKRAKRGTGDAEPGSEES
jgi:bifunctional UDP-N-acetylglucosamine pyrophosphorylase/glucosamine-1-phosphate N-acetyltransferase